MTSTSSGPRPDEHDDARAGDAPASDSTTEQDSSRSGDAAGPSQPDEQGPAHETAGQEPESAAVESGAPDEPRRESEASGPADSDTDAEERPPAPGDEASSGSWSSEAPTGWQMAAARATATAPAPAAAEQERRRVWDPRLGRFVDAVTGIVLDEPRAPEQEEAPDRGFAAPPPARPPGVGRGVTALVGGVVGAVLAVVAMLFVPGPVDRQATRGAAPPSVSSPRQGTDGVSGGDLARTARPWVVNVAASGTAAGALGPREFTRLGSGVVIQSDGVVATTARLLEGASKITVTLAHGGTVDAQVVGADDLSDIAVLRVSNADLPAAVLGTAEHVDLADPVVAVASPTGLQPVVVTGSISGVGHTVDAGDGRVLFDMLQITGPMGMGGGGAVVMGSGGSAIALTSSLAESSGVAGYAVPIDVVRTVADQLLKSGKAAHPWIGLVVQPLDQDSSRRIQSPGLVVVRTFDGPATGKIGPGDIVIAVDGRAVEGAQTLLKRLLEHKVGDEVALGVVRGDDRLDVQVTVEEQPAP